MTLPNERVLVGGTKLDEAMSKMFEMAGARTSESIASFKKALGLAAVRKMYLWAKDHANAGLGAEIEWKRNVDARFKFSATADDLAVLQGAIEQTSEEEQATTPISGILLGLDVGTRKFHMRADDGGEIKGEVSPKIGTKRTVALGTRHTATLLIKRKVHFATEQEDFTYFMLDLE
ncbi:MAG: hypothetical protein FD161_2031 [Limisphaerales bacterium]|nr:MAG: hypothetical protein FD161_2031 [Limisphaerales bacterium]KAG0509071.1 MAG: hypothetical protein E1N63_1833 [Limisphaerales bacterium]